MKWDKILSSGIAGCGTLVNYLWGGADVALKTLLLFMLFDYLTGLICATKEKCISSAIGFNGILKKVTILIVVAVGFSLDNITGTNGLVRSLVIFFYVSMEGISILENAARMNVGIPEQLKDILLQLKEEKKGSEINESTQIVFNGKCLL